MTPTTVMDESGPLQIGEYSIRTWNNEYHGPITMTKILERSSNVGMVFLAQKLGKDTLLQYIRDFGFGKPTGIDVEEESSPALREVKDWTQIDLATVSFGQGIAVTPMQMVRAVGALANEGWLMEPHVVKEIVESRGRVVTIKPKKIRQVISPGTARIITEMMVAAVDNGEAKWAKPQGYRIAGKTGTAQIPVAGHYDDKKTIASFVGFAPADDPKFVMLVTLREPTNSPWGSGNRGSALFTIARDLFRYYGISPANKWYTKTMLRSLKWLYHLLVAMLAVIWFRFPGRKLTVIGVTGTDGKTTTTSLIYEILKLAGYKTSMITSVNAVIAGKCMIPVFM